MTPLALPEIVSLVSWFLLLWETPFPAAIPVVRPKTLAVCLGVNRLWHRTLTPLLWRVFYAKDSVHRRTPQSVIQNYSLHARYAELSFYFPTPTLHLACLRELDMFIPSPRRSGS